MQKWCQRSRRAVLVGVSHEGPSCARRSSHRRMGRYTAKWLAGHSLLSITSPNLRELSEGRRSVYTQLNENPDRWLLVATSQFPLRAAANGHLGRDFSCLRRTSHRQCSECGELYRPATTRFRHHAWQHLHCRGERAGTREHRCRTDRFPIHELEWHVREGNRQCHNRERTDVLHVGNPGGRATALQYTTRGQELG